MSETLLIGRRKYIFTRPDGTFLVQKPRCCRRIFKETQNINRGTRTYSRSKTADPNLVAWNKFISETRKKEDGDTSELVDKKLFEAAQETLDDVDDILKRAAAEEEPKESETSNPSV